MSSSNDDDGDKMEDKDDSEGHFHDKNVENDHAIQISLICHSIDLKDYPKQVVIDHLSSVDELQHLLESVRVDIRDIHLTHESLPHVLVQHAVKD